MTQVRGSRLFAFWVASSEVWQRLRVMRHLLKVTIRHASVFFDVSFSPSAARLLLTLLMWIQYHAPDSRPRAFAWMARSSLPLRSRGALKARLAVSRTEVDSKLTPPAHTTRISQTKLVPGPDHHLHIFPQYMRWEKAKAVRKWESRVEMRTVRPEMIRAIRPATRTPSDRRAQALHDQL